MSMIYRKAPAHRLPSAKEPPRRGWVTPVVVVVVLASVVAAVAVLHRTRPVAPGIAGEAVLTASSTAPGYSVRDLVGLHSARQIGPCADTLQMHYH